MDPQVKLQYIQAATTLILGLVGIFLPQKFNPFRFRARGVGKIISNALSEKVKERIPKVIGALCVFTGIAVAILTTILGPMPWQ